MRFILRIGKSNSYCLTCFAKLVILRGVQHMYVNDSGLSFVLSHATD